MSPVVYIHLHFANGSDFYANIPSMLRRLERRMVGLLEQLVALW